MGRIDTPRRRRVLLLFAWVLMSAPLQLGAPFTADWLRYDRARIQSGELWRLLSAHLIHLGWGHWALNTGALALVFALYGRQLSPAACCGWALISALSIGLGLLLCSPSVLWYVGLSGVLYGLLAAGAITDLSRHPAVSIAVLALLTVKLVWEQLWGPLSGAVSLVGGAVVVDAHLYGTVGGLVAALLWPVVAAHLVVARRLGSRSARPQVQPESEQKQGRPP